MNDESLNETTEKNVYELVDATCDFLLNRISPNSDYTNTNIAINVLYGCIVSIVVKTLPESQWDRFAITALNHLNKNFDANRIKRGQ